MSKRIGITAILLLFLIVASAQKKLSYIDADKKSFELYQQQKWNELIDFSSEVRAQGIDFFYLQARTGIAYYNLKKYRTAADWFLKAWENDKSFEWLQEYLYYSLIYSGRSAEASKVANNFSNSFKQKIDYQKMKPTRAALEVGYSFNSDFDQLSNTNFDEEINVSDDYGVAFILKDYHFESVDFSHQIAPGIFLNHNFTHLGINREEQVYWGERYSFPIKVKQNQYFINPVFVLGKKWYVSSSATIIWGNSDLVLGDYNPNTFYSSSVKFSDFIFSASTWSHWGNFSPGAEIIRANIYNENFTQLSSWITFYPLSNNNFYLTPRLYVRGGDENHLWYSVFEISGGVQLGPVHFYGKYLNGEMKNFIESAGYVVANFPGKSNRKFMGSLYFPFAKKYQFVLRYINQDIVENYQVYTNQQPSNSAEYKYIKHTLTGGISWNF